MIRRLAVLAVNAAAWLADKAICAWPNTTHQPHPYEEDQC